MAKKIGRPKQERGNKDIHFNLRLDEDTFSLLNRCAAVLEVSRSTIIRNGIKQTAEEHGIK